MPLATTVASSLAASAEPFTTVALATAAEPFAAVALAAAALATAALTAAALTAAFTAALSLAAAAVAFAAAAEPAAAASAADAAADAAATGLVFQPMHGLYEHGRRPTHVFVLDRTLVLNGPSLYDSGRALVRLVAQLRCEALPWGSRNSGL